MIKRLPPQISNQIAAGEVIERPAAVVKELIENAIDAGASQIRIAIADAGKALIEVVDNGCGIAKADLPLLFERHATSKIAKLEDIYAIATLGFRGEALASIAAVARVNVISRRADSDVAYRLQVAAGKAAAIETTAGNVGTTISVRDLFYNTPVRYKFLASNRIEAAAITATVERMMMANPAIRFSYQLDGKMLRSSDGDNQLKNVLHAIYGSDFTRNMLTLSTAQGEVSLHGYISKPEYTRGNRRFQTIFVNRRYVECPILQDAINDSYRTLNTIHRFPLFVLHITLPAAHYDVNIHPAKTEIKFHDVERLKTLAERSVKQCFSDNCLVPSVNLTGEEAPPVDSETSKITQYFERFSKKMNESEVYLGDQFSATSADESAAQYRVTTPPTAPVTAPEQGVQSLDERPDETYDDLFIDDDAAFGEQVQLSEAPTERRATHYDGLTIVGVLFNTYIVCQREDSAFLIDQHAAHERVLFEQFLADFRRASVEAQYLLQPFVYQSDAQTDAYITHLAEQIKQMGIDIEPFGDFSWLVRSVPTIKGLPFSEQSVTLLLDAIDSTAGEAITEHNLEAIILASCKAAVKARDRLSERELYELLDLLSTYNQPYTCPHGRPIIIELTEYQLEKLFKRIQ